MSAALDQTSVSLTVSGTADAMGSLTADKIECYVDLSGLTAEGTQPVKVMLTLPDGISKTAMSPETINVTLKKNVSGGQ